MGLDPALFPIHPMEQQINARLQLERRVGAIERDRPAVSEWQTPTLESGFTNLPDYAPVGYYRDTFGRVYLRGGVNHGSEFDAGATIFTLEEGNRPPFKHTFYVAAEDQPTGDIPQWVTVNTDGSVVAHQVGSEGGKMYLDAIQFRSF